VGIKTTNGVPSNRHRSTSIRKYSGNYQDQQLVTKVQPWLQPVPIHCQRFKPLALNIDMRMLCSVALLVSLLSGCAVYTPSGSVVVDPHDGGGRGGFCPPGQAKKGNC